MTMNKRRGAEARRREGSIIRTFALSVIIALSILAFVIYFFVQISAERDIRNALFDQYKQRQDQTTKEISDHLSSDLDSVRLTLEKIAGSPTVQRGELSG